MLYGPYEAVFYHLMDSFDDIREEDYGVTFGYIRPDVSGVIQDAKTLCRMSEDEWKYVMRDIQRHYWLVFWPKKSNVPEIVSVPAAAYRLEFDK